MSARFVARVVLAFAAIALLLFGPGYIAKENVTDDPGPKVIARAYDLLEATVPNLELDRKQTVDGGLPRGGGGRTAFQCARILEGAQGWACVALKADGREGAAIWVAPKPNVDGARFLVPQGIPPGELPEDLQP